MLNYALIILYIILAGAIVLGTIVVVTLRKSPKVKAEQNMQEAPQVELNTNELETPVVTTKLIVVDFFCNLPTVGDVNDVYKINFPYPSYYRFTNQAYVELATTYNIEAYKVVSTITVGYNNEIITFTETSTTIEESYYQAFINWYYSKKSKLFKYEFKDGFQILDRSLITYVQVQNRHLG